MVVGAGAAGIMAAWRAASLGAKVTLVEKTNRIGTKILVSGGGKCNVAHAGEIEEVLRPFRPNEARFIRPACYRWSNAQIVKFFEEGGLKVYVRPDGRVFPVDQTAKDVVQILRNRLEEVEVNILLRSPVLEILSDGAKITGIRCGTAREKLSDDSPPGIYRSASAKNLLRELGKVEVLEGEKRIGCPRVILCSGGSSYPNSGTTGDGWNWAQSLGHSIQKVRAALAPIYLRSPLSDLAGVSLRSVKLRAKVGKEIASWLGDLLFTHDGVSGPCALGISRVVAEQADLSAVNLEIDLLPSILFEDLQAEWVQLGTKQPHRLVFGTIPTELPERLIKVLFDIAGVSLEITFAKLDRKSRNRLLNALKSFPLGAVKAVPLEKGEVVAGGISLDEVDPHTMKSLRMPGLYLCGEILDVAGPVGGYNLQAAFATGYVAGESAARDISS